MSQNVPFSGIKVSGLMPALLRRSRPWGSRARRLLLPSEALEVQGIGPIYNKDDYSDDEIDKSVMRTPPSVVRPAFYNSVVMGAFTDGEVRSLAGNSMPIPMIGAALNFVLACTQRV